MYKDLEEVQQLRRPKSKTFKNPDGSNKLVLSQNLQHYTDGNGQQQDIDLTPCEDEEGICTYVEKAPYRAEVSKDKPKITYYSRQYGDATAELISIDDIPQSEFNIQRKIEGSKVIFEEIIPGVDVYCKFKTTGVEWFKVIKGPDSGFKFEWEQSKTKQANCKFAEKTKGWDKRRKRLDIQSNREENKKDPNRETTTYTENITHKAQKIVDKETRKKEFSEDPEYPLLVDVSIDEQITDGTHDGIAGDFFSTANYVIIVGENYGNFLYGFSTFTNVPLPQGVVINSATYRHFVTAAGAGNILVQIAIQDITDAIVFSNVTQFNNRTTHNNGNFYSPPASGNYFSPNITSFIQRIADKTGWTSSNNIGFILNPNTNATDAFALQAADEGSSNAGAFLEIDYTEPSTEPDEISSSSNITFTLESLSQLAQIQNLDSSTDINVIAQNLQNILGLISNTDTIQILLQNNTTIEVSLEQTETLFLALNILQNLQKEFSTTDTLTLTLNNLTNLVDVFSSVDSLNIDLQYLTELASTLTSTDNIQITLQDDTTINVSLQALTSLLVNLNTDISVFNDITTTDTIILTLLTAIQNFAETTSTSTLNITLESIEDLLKVLTSTTQIELETQEDADIRALLESTTNTLVTFKETTNIATVIQKQDNLITVFNTSSTVFLENSSSTNLTLTLEETANLLSLLTESDNILIKIEKDENFNIFNFTWQDIDDSADQTWQTISTNANQNWQDINDNANQEWREVRTNDIIED